MFPFIATAIGLTIGAFSSSNPIVALICGVTLGLIAWALTGFKVSSGVEQHNIDKPVASLTDEELVSAIKSATGTKLDVLTVEAVARQKSHEAKRAEPFKLDSLFPGDNCVVITDKAFESADAGNVDMQALIGGAYLAGANGLPQNLYKASIYLLKAAEQGHGFSCFVMATLYIEGMGGLTQSVDNAFIWAVRAKSLGVPDADLLLKLIDSKRIA